MHSKETILAKYTATRACPTAGHGKRALIKVTAQAYHLGSNAHPHFSVTGEIYIPGKNDIECGGCIHDEVLNYFPHLAPLIALHLSNADDGEPLYAMGNGFYHLAGCVDGNFGQEYHAGNSGRHFPITPPADKPWKNTEYRFPTKEECVTLTAEYLRTTEEAIQRLLPVISNAYKAGADSVASSPDVSAMAEKARTKAGAKAAQEAFATWVDNLRPQWQAECDAGIALIHSLNAKQEAAA